jgi:RNA polymerase sigma-70 factor (ECF subfamily)
MISPSLAAPPTASVRPASDFEHEVLPHLETLSRVARRMTRHQPAAEDLVQDTLERACRYFWRFQPGTNIRAWLLTIMSNVYISDCRRRTAAPRMVSLDVIDDVSLSHQVAWAAPGGCDVEASAVDRLAEEFILGRIEVLPPHLRAVARLAWVDGLAYQGVADTLRIPLGTVGSRLHRARYRLRHALRRQADPAHRVMGAACGRKADAGPANAA